MSHREKLQAMKRIVDDLLAEPDESPGFAVWEPGIEAKGRTLLRLISPGADPMVVVVDEGGEPRSTGYLVRFDLSGKLYRFSHVGDYGFCLDDGLRIALED